MSSRLVVSGAVLGSLLTVGSQLRAGEEAWVAAPVKKARVLLRRSEKYSPGAVAAVGGRLFFSNRGVSDTSSDTGVFEVLPKGEVKPLSADLVVRKFFAVENQLVVEVPPTVEVPRQWLVLNENDEFVSWQEEKRKAVTASLRFELHRTGKSFGEAGKNLYRRPFSLETIGVAGGGGAFSALFEEQGTTGVVGGFAWAQKPNLNLLALNEPASDLALLGNGDLMVLRAGEREGANLPPLVATSNPEKGLLWIENTKSLRRVSRLHQASSGGVLWFNQTSQPGEANGFWYVSPLGGEPTRLLDTPQFDVWNYFLGEPGLVISTGRERSIVLYADEKDSESLKWADKFFTSLKQEPAAACPDYEVAFIDAERTSAELYYKEIGAGGRLEPRSLGRFTAGAPGLKVWCHGKGGVYFIAERAELNLSAGGLLFDVLADESYGTNVSRILELAAMNGDYSVADAVNRGKELGVVTNPGSLLFVIHGRKIRLAVQPLPETAFSEIFKGILRLKNPDGSSFTEYMHSVEPDGQEIRHLDYLPKPVNDAPGVSP